MRTVQNAAVPAFLRRRWAVKVGVAITLVLLLIAGIGAFMYVETGEQLSADTQARMQTAAETQSTALSEWVQGSKRQAHVLAQSEAVQSGDTARITSFLTHTVQSDVTTDEVVAIHYLDTASGQFRASSADAMVGASPASMNLPSAELTAELQGHEAVVSAPFTTPESDRKAIAVVAAVPDTDDRALVLWLDLEHRSGELPRPVSRSFTKVVDSDGTTVLSHRTEQIMTQNMGEAGVDSMAVKRGLQGETGYMEMPMMGTVMTMGFAPVEGTDWVLMVHSPRATMYAVQQQVTQNLLLLLGTALLGFGLVAGLVARDTTRTLNRLTSKAKVLEAGDLDVGLESGRIDEFGRLYAAFGSMRDSLRESIETAESARERAEAERAETARLVDHLEAKADQFSAGMERAADGDLSVRLSRESDSEAMAQIAAAFNDMVTDLERTVERIQDFAVDVATASEEVTASTEEVKTASEQVSESIQEISVGADEQQSELDAVSAEMAALSGSIEEVASAADQVAATTEQAAELGDDGRESATAAIDTLETIENATASTAAEVEALVDEIEAIGESVDRIGNIASETDMLALNAAIEASRATDESGAGFAVVAEQVKSLAAEAGDAAAEIEARIDDIQGAADDALAGMHRTNEHVSEGTGTIEEAIDTLDTLAEQVETANVGVQEIDQVTDDQATSTEETASQVDSVSRLASESSEAAEEVSAAAEEQASSLTEVAENVHSLAARADELRLRMDAFTVGRGDGDAPRSGPDSESSAAADGGRPE